MATDRHESAKRGQQRKPSGKHPFIGIEHRIFDSPAFVKLKPTAKVALFAIARQLRKDNNGHLQATASWFHRYGIGSEHTVQQAIAQLIAHGLIYRTRSHGANGQWAKYALTWLPIPKKDGLFLAGFVANAWRDWHPAEKKSTPQKLQDDSRKKCSFTTEFPAESAGTLPAKTAEYESVLPCTDSKTLTGDAGQPPESYGQWLGDYLKRLAAVGPQFSEACSVADPSKPRVRKDRQRRAWLSPHLIRQSNTMDRGCLRLEASHAR